MTISQLDFAIFYAEKGWLTFPIKPHDKTPLTEHGFKDATCKPDAIREWWDKYPLANIGIATGEQSKIFVLDVDTQHGGEETLSILLQQRGQFPATPTAHTGGGGRHILFEFPQGQNIRNSAGRLGAGLDTRGNGGYIVAANSIHPNGKQYEWERAVAPSKTKVAAAPDWLIQMLTDPATKTMPSNTGEGAFISGQRNNALASIAGAMRRKGLSEDEIFTALNAVNLNRCMPPLSEKEVLTIAQSVTRYDPAAAPVTQSKDRLAAEWAFAKCIFEIPDNALDYQSIRPEYFSDDALRDFWRGVLSGTNTATAAVNAAILSELERYQDYLIPRLDGYAAVIENFGKLSSVARNADALRRAAQAGNWPEVGRVVMDINKNDINTRARAGHISTAFDDFENEVKTRAADPKDVWGIPYAWEHLSKLTGGKQPGELILCAGEPGVGKSWFWLQDALFTAMGSPSKKIAAVPVMYWTGEMQARQVVRRLAALLGLDAHRSRTGKMSDDDWQSFDDAKAMLYNIPLLIDDQPLQLFDLRPLLKQKQDEIGVRQVIIDYAMKIKAPGKDEIEKTQNISDELKNICNDLQLSIVLIASVTKSGMDIVGDTVSKASVRGSGQQIHDADNIYTLTKYNASMGDQERAKKMVTLHIQKGRELDYSLVNGFINYERMPDSPKFAEVMTRRINLNEGA